MLEDGLPARPVNLAVALPVKQFMAVPITELRVRIPDLLLQVDEETIKQVLADSPGIGDVEPDHRTHTLRFTTASQDGGREALDRLANAGYPVDDED